MPRHRRGRPPPSRTRKTRSTKSRQRGPSSAAAGTSPNASNLKAALTQADGIACTGDCHQANQPQRGEKSRRVLEWVGVLVLGTVVREAAEMVVDWARTAIPWDLIPWGSIWPW